LKSFFQFLGRAYKYFRGTKRVWRKPPRADLLIIDRGTANPLDEMFAHHNPHIMDIRGESVNMLALLRAVPKIHLGAVAYLEAYIDFVNPKLILSRTDNNATLWQLKRRTNSTYKVALIQNGWRTPHETSISKPVGLLDNTVDTYFSFGNCSSTLIAGYIRANFVEIGSLKANHYEHFTRNYLGADIALISTYREKDKKSYREFDKFIENLSKVCLKKSLSIIVIGCQIGETEQLKELSYYENLIWHCNWKFHKKIDTVASYEALRLVRLVIVENSTLGYESLVLGMRTGFFTVRAKNFATEQFAQMLGLDARGKFWTNDATAEEIERILSYLSDATEVQWRIDSGAIIGQLISHDFRNIKLRSYVREILN